MSNIIMHINQFVAYLVGGSVPPDDGESVPVIISFSESWIGRFVSVIVDNPILLIFTIASLVFLGINAVRRLMSV